MTTELTWGLLGKVKSFLHDREASPVPGPARLQAIFHALGNGDPDFSPETLVRSSRGMGLDQLARLLFTAVRIDGETDEQLRDRLTVSLRIGKGT